MPMFASKQIPPPLTVSRMFGSVCEMVAKTNVTTGNSSRLQGVYDMPPLLSLEKLNQKTRR